MSRTHVALHLFLGIALLNYRVQAAPEQVHLSLCAEPDCMSVSWVTMRSEGPQKIVYGRDLNAPNHEKLASTKEWTFKGIKRYMHRVRINNLRYDSKYYYYVGNKPSISKTFFFYTVPKGDNFPYKVGIVGDLGITGKSIPFMIEATQKRWINMVVHIGDIAYDLQDQQGKRGDEYMKKIEPIAAYIPYLVIAGNHEEDGVNFANYRWRFDMPNSPSGDNQYYSVNVGPVHWVGLSSEIYAFSQQMGAGRIQDQYQWLIRDMETAKQRRNSQPWIIAFQHRPIYCSDKFNQCHGSDNLQLRYDKPGSPALEPVYTKYGVDMMFSGHHHFYERYFPRSNRHTTILNMPYVNAKAPVYVVSGTGGGAAGHHTNFHAKPSHLSVVRNTDNSYTVMHIHNKTHLFMKQISVEGKAKEVDKLWLIKSLGYNSGYA